MIQTVSRHVFPLSPWRARCLGGMYIASEGCSLTGYVAEVAADVQTLKQIAAGGTGSGVDNSTSPASLDASQPGTEAVARLLNVLATDHGSGSWGWRCEIEAMSQLESLLRDKLQQVGGSVLTLGELFSFPFCMIIARREEKLPQSLSTQYIL